MSGARVQGSWMFARAWFLHYSPTEFISSFWTLTADMREKWEDSKVNVWPVGWGITETVEDKGTWGGTQMERWKENKFCSFDTQWELTITIRRPASKKLAKMRYFLFYRKELRWRAQLENCFLSCSACTFILSPLFSLLYPSNRTSSPSSQPLRPHQQHIRSSPVICQLMAGPFTVFINLQAEQQNKNNRHITINVNMWSGLRPPEVK